MPCLATASDCHAAFVPSNWAKISASTPGTSCTKLQLGSPSTEVEQPRLPSYHLPPWALPLPTASCQPPAKPSPRKLRWLLVNLPNPKKLTGDLLSATPPELQLLPSSPPLRATPVSPPLHPKPQIGFPFSWASSLAPLFPVARRRPVGIASEPPRTKEGSKSPVSALMGRKFRVGWAQSYSAGLSALRTKPTATFPFRNVHLI
jgi:hypothetical protein